MRNMGNMRKQYGRNMGEIAAACSGKPAFQGENLSDGSSSTVLANNYLSSEVQGPPGPKLLGASTSSFVPLGQNQ